MLFHEPMVWVGSPQFETWRRQPLPIAVYEESSLGRRSAIQSLALQGRPYKVVYNSSILAGQVAGYRSRASQHSKAVDSLHRMLVQTLRHAG